MSELAALGRLKGVSNDGLRGPRALVQLRQRLQEIGLRLVDIEARLGATDTRTIHSP
jgi:hypothetical protein